MPKVERITPTRPQPQAGRPAAPAQVGRVPAGPRALAGALSVPIAQVYPDPGQPRKDFDDDALGALASSIRENGVLQPLIVRDSGEPDAMGNDLFIIIAGERRWRAAQRAGLAEIPVVVRALEEADPTTRVLQLIENLQREDLNIVERSAALKALKVNLGSPSGKPATWDDVAARVGVSKRRVLQLAGVADLAEPVQEALRTGTLTEKHTRAMNGLSPEQQHGLTTVTVDEGLTPDETTAAARAMKRDTTIDATQAAARTRKAHTPREDASDTSGNARSWSPRMAPIEGLKAALGPLNVAAVFEVARFGAGHGWSCAQLVVALEAVGERPE